jgi:hypothetical protein
MPHDIGSAGNMIFAGYMFKMVSRRPDWLKTMASVSDIYSVSGCVSGNFADYIKYWKHNGWWLFDSPAAMQDLAKAENLDLSGMTLFFYEVFDQQFDEATGEWSTFGPEPSFRTEVEQPKSARLEGYDVATFFAGTSPECSPLSCNGVAESIAVNQHCLFDTFEQAKAVLEAGAFNDTEPGPMRIFVVYTVRP